MADKKYKINFELSNGTTKSVEFIAPQGEKGEPGYTPVKGTDYWTSADQESIVQQVIAALGTPVFGRVDADKNIILSGELADGTYTIKYEGTEGEQTIIGTLEQGGTSYTNLADPSSADWLTNKRYSSDGTIKESTPAITTNYIPLKMGDDVRVRYMNIYHHGTGTGSALTTFFDANKNRIAYGVPANNPNLWVQDADGLGCSFNMTTVSEKFTIVSGPLSDICYVRFSGKLYDGYTADDIIITVNEEITE